MISCRKRKDELIGDIALIEAYLGYSDVPEFKEMFKKTLTMLQKELKELEGYDEIFNFINGTYELCPKESTSSREKKLDKSRKKK